MGGGRLGRTRPHHQIEHSRLHHAVHIDVQDRKLSGVRSNATVLFSPGFSVMRSKPFNCITGWVTMRPLMNVELRDLVAFARAGVGHVDGDFRGLRREESARAPREGSRT